MSTGRGSPDATATALANAAWGAAARGFDDSAAVLSNAGGFRRNTPGDADGAWPPAGHRHSTGCPALPCAFCSSPKSAPMPAPPKTSSSSLVDILLLLCWYARASVARGYGG